MNRCKYITAIEEIAELLIADGMLFSVMNNTGYFLRLDERLHAPIVPANFSGSMKLYSLDGTFQQVITLLRLSQTPATEIVERFEWSNRDQFFTHLLELVNAGLCGVIIDESDSDEEEKEQSEEEKE